MEPKLTEDRVREIIKEEMKKKSDVGQGFNDVSYHEHTGADSPKIDPNNLLGFPIRTSTPTDSAIQGKIVLSDISGTRKIWARINGTWYSVTVT